MRVLVLTWSSYTPESLLSHYKSRLSKLNDIKLEKRKINISEEQRDKKMEGLCGDNDWKKGRGRGRREQREKEFM